MSLLVVQHRILGRNVLFDLRIYTMNLMMEHDGVVLADLVDYPNFKS